jgi:murein DD-endopeptidase MepM/ murein hydrolase activator NlpD
MQRHITRSLTTNPFKALSSLSNLPEKIHEWLPERQIFYRRRGQVSFISISRRLQILIVCSLVTFAGWIGYSTIYYLSFDHVLRDKNRQIAEARVAYRSAMQEVAGYNSRLMKITRNLERSQAELLTLFNPKSVAQQRNARTKSGMTDLDRALAEASHRVMTKRIKELEREWRELAARNATLEHGLASIGNEVENILTEHGIVTAERNRLRDRVKVLETTLSGLRSRQDKFLTSLSTRASNTIAEASKVLKMTGLDLNTLIAEAARADGETLGQGGPFISAPNPEDPLELKAAILDQQMKRWKYIREVFRRLPLTAPIEHYRLSSPFGIRRDPFTGRRARHNGMDFAYAVNTPVMATASGTVVFAGWRGGYGWSVEIDHGLGVRTRYAHMRKLLVKRGEKVHFRSKLGLLGSTGRSNGPHVHYEILVNGKPVNPANFLKAGKYVFKG